MIGILYPGDMGASLGRILQEDGRAVLTTLEGRSERTRELCRRHGLETVPTLAALVQQARVVISLVPPAAAVEVAEQYCAWSRQAPAGAVFIDANPVCPATALRIAELVQDAGVAFVDGAIHGVAGQLRRLGTLYLSGARAGEVAALFAPSLRVKDLGPEPGQASAFKMLLGGVSKGLVALFLEVSLLAGAVGLEGNLDECLRHFYPGFMAVIERIVPTYPQHAARRADEMGELQEMMRALDVEPFLVPGVRRLLEKVAEADFSGAERWTVAEVVRRVRQATRSGRDLRHAVDCRTQPCPSGAAGSGD